MLQILYIWVSVSHLVQHRDIYLIARSNSPPCGSSRIGLMNRYLKRIHQHGMFIKDISHSAGSHFYSEWSPFGGFFRPTQYILRSTTIKECKLLQSNSACLLSLRNTRNPHPVALESETTSISSSSNRAVVSTLYSDSYAIGVAVLGYSISSTNISARLLLPYLEERVSANTLCVVRAAGWEPHPVTFIPPPHHGEGVHPRFGDQYTKLNIWTFDQLGIESLVYLDADTLVLRNFEELFELGFSFAAVPDVYGGRRGFIISFNAGVLAINLRRRSLRI